MWHCSQHHLSFQNSNFLKCSFRTIHQQHHMQNMSRHSAKLFHSQQNCDRIICSLVCSHCSRIHKIFETHVGLHVCTLMYRNHTASLPVNPSTGQRKVYEASAWHYHVGPQCSANLQRLVLGHLSSFQCLPSPHALPEQIPTHRCQSLGSI